MITASDTFLAALRGPHVLAVQAIAYPPIGNPIDLPVEDGAVVIDRTASQRRQLSLSVSDPGLYPLLPSDAISVYGTEIIVQRGVTFANNATEMISLGVFRIDTVERTIPGGSITITGSDRSTQIADERFRNPRKFSADTATNIIETLISEVYDGTALPAAVFDVQTTAGTTTIPKHVVQQDRWAEIQRIAQVIGCDVYPTEDGTWRIIDVPDATTQTPVWTVDAGPTGVLISADDAVTRLGAPNIVVAQGQSVSGSNPIHSHSPHGFDDDPTSPTYYLGAYGAVPVFYQSNHIRTQAQADRVADAQLADHLGASRTINFNTVPNPALDAGDLIVIVRPDGSSENHVIDALSIPLGPSGEMQGETRVVSWNVS